MSRFPDTPAFTGFNTPSRIEGDAFDLAVEGAIPLEIEGAFYRVQPDPQFPPLLGNDIPFNGDGMITMFSFKDGRIDFRQRWAQTDKWKLEHAHGGRLYALKEDSPALVMEPDTLETIGYTDFGGRMTGETFTAHPKIDPATGDMIGFGYASKGICTRDMTYYEVAPDGTLKREIWFENPYYCMMHDFAVTRDYALFHVVPITGSWERMEQGRPHFGFDTTLPVHLGVLPRREGATAAYIRWFTTDNCFASHVMNAFQDGDRIHFDTPVAKNNMFPFFPDVHGAPFNPMEAASFLTRWTVNMASNSDAFESKTRLTNMAGEFPRIDDRYQGLPYRYGWLLVIDMSKPVELKGGSAGGAVMNT
ncbi:MAG: carotenoid oxygenase family protein, partial [Sphingomonas sp.]|nr:carotenoid oxygenase family protein [Sphingomonas sp.]